MSFLLLIKLYLRFNLLIYFVNAIELLFIFLFYNIKIYLLSDFN